MGFPCGSAGKELACHAGDLGCIPGLGRSPGEGKGYPLQYSGLENSMDFIVHRVSKSQTGLSDFHAVCKMERQGPMVKNCKVFQDSDSRAFNQALDLSEHMRVPLHRPHA